MLTAEGPQIVDPPQYSIAWVILALLCVLVILALILGTLRITRAVVERAAYRQRPTDVEGLKAEFLRALVRIEDDVSSGRADARQAHRQITAVMRRFARSTTGVDITHQDLPTLVADPRTRPVGLLLSELYEPEFAASSQQQVATSLRRAREVVRAWS